MDEQLLGINELTQSVKEVFSKMWFMPREGDEITISDSQTKARLLEMYFNAEMKSHVKEILHDPVLSEFLRANVYYLSDRRMKSVIKMINKRCDMVIPLDARYLKIRFDNKYFILGNYGVEADIKYYAWNYLGAICMSMQTNLDKKMAVFMQLLYIQYDERYCIRWGTQRIL